MSGWIDKLTPSERDSWDEFVEHFRRDTLGKIAGSEAFVSIAPEEFDVQFCVELGTAIMLDKPLLVVAPTGRVVPEKLRAVADEIVTADLDVAEGQRRIADALAAMLEEQP